MSWLSTFKPLVPQKLTVCIVRHWAALTLDLLGSFPWLFICYSHNPAIQLGVDFPLLVTSREVDHTSNDNKLLKMVYSCSHMNVRLFEYYTISFTSDVMVYNSLSDLLRQLSPFSGPCSVWWTQ